MIATSPSRGAASEQAARDVYFQFQYVPQSALPVGASHRPAAPARRVAVAAVPPRKHVAAFVGYVLFGLGYLCVVALFYAIFFGQLAG